MSWGIPERDPLGTRRKALWGEKPGNQGLTIMEDRSQERAWRKVRMTEAMWQENGACEIFWDLTHSRDDHGRP
jgi:hypothetical protein